MAVKQSANALLTSITGSVSMIAAIFWRWRGYGDGQAYEKVQAFYASSRTRGSLLRLRLYSTTKIFMLTVCQQVVMGSTQQRIKQDLIQEIEEFNEDYDADNFSEKIRNWHRESLEQALQDLPGEDEIREIVREEVKDVLENYGVTINED